MSSTTNRRHRPEVKARLVLDAAQRAATYYTTARDRGVLPDEQAIEALGAFPTELGDEPVAAGDVVRMLDELGSPGTMMTTAGRYFGYVNGGNDPVAAAAAVLVSAWDQNVALPAMSPTSAHLDELAARWSCRLLGLPDSAIATFCSGASIANLTCVLAARDTLLHRVGWSVDRAGLAGAPMPPVVASAEIHSSVRKGLRAAGFGADDIVWVPTDECGRVRVEGFPELERPALVLLQAGNVNTGHSDPFRHIVPIVQRSGGWVHVDGAFGLWANTSDAHRHHVDGVELADSWATDAHKWLNAPYDSGIAICREPDDLRRSMAFDAAYFETDAERALAHLGLQMSQRARGVEIWALLSGLGHNGVVDLVDRSCRHADHMAALLDAAGADIVVPTALNQVLVRFDDDSTTDAVIAAVQADRTCWAGGTTWHGMRAMRISVCDAATTSEDIDVSARAIIRCWHSCARS